MNMIDVFGNDMDEACILFKKENEKNGTYVSLSAIHPECIDCRLTADEDECDYCYSSGYFKKKPTYRVAVYHNDGTKSIDKFEEFSEAFDSFSGIVRTLTKEFDMLNKEGST